MKTITLSLMLLFTACASIEERCLRKTQAQEDLDQDLRSEYYRGCVNRKLKAVEMMSRAYQGPAPSARPIPGYR